MFWFNKKKKQKPVKLLGVAKVMTDAEESFYMQRYLTLFYYTPNDREFVEKLKLLGFKIINQRPRCLEVYLPFNWLHFRRNSTEEIVADERGRVRIVIDNKAKTALLLRRFNFSAISVESIRNFGCIHLKIYDAGKIIQEKTLLDKVPGVKFWERFNISKLAAIELGNMECIKYLDQTVPDWRNELAYW